jgi:hypothetical protein
MRCRTASFVSAKREADVPRRLRDDVRHARQQIVHQRRVTCMTPEQDFHVERHSRRSPRLKQQIDKDPVAAIGRHATRRRVRLMDVPTLIQLHQDVADGRGRHTEPAFSGKHL